MAERIDQLYEDYRYKTLVDWYLKQIIETAEVEKTLEREREEHQQRLQTAQEEMARERQVHQLVLEEMDREREEHHLRLQSLQLEVSKAQEALVQARDQDRLVLKAKQQLKNVELFSTEMFQSFNKFLKEQTDVVIALEQKREENQKHRMKLEEIHEKPQTSELKAAVAQRGPDLVEGQEEQKDNTSVQQVFDFRDREKSGKHLKDQTQRLSEVAEDHEKLQDFEFEAAGAEGGLDLVDEQEEQKDNTSVQQDQEESLSGVDEQPGQSNDDNQPQKKKKHKGWKKFVYKIQPWQRGKK